MVHKALGRVEVGPQRRPLEVFGDKTLPVKAAKDKLHTAGLIHAGEAKHPLVLQGEQVGALQHRAHLPGFKQGAHIVPVEQILRAVQHHRGVSLLAHAADHAVRAVLPGEHLGVPEVPAGRVYGALGQNGVARVLCKVLAVVGPGQALGLGQAAVHGGVEKVQPAVLLHRGAGEAALAAFIGLVGVQGDGQLLPVEQVLADGVAPVHGVPHRGLGVVLEKDVVLPLEVAQAVGVVYPAALRLEVQREFWQHGWLSFRYRREKGRAPAGPGPRPRTSDTIMIQQEKIFYKSNVCPPRDFASSGSWVTTSTVLPWVRARK